MKKKKVEPYPKQVSEGYSMYSYDFDQADEGEAEVLHVHPHHEIFMLLDGRIDYMIEGALFPLHPWDIVVIGAGEPHAKCVTYSGDVKIFVINVEKGFFSSIGCPEYEDIFKKHDTTEHVISAESAKNLGLMGAIQRLGVYTDDFTNNYTQIAKFILAEILYLINKKEFSNRFIANAQIKTIIDFINANYTRRISLEEIAKNVFLSKYYVCKIFKKHMGLTVKDYITQKRLANVDTLVADGANITNACINSGFSDYSTFYNAFLKEKGNPPKKLLKKH